jgi:hypothetical protein
MARVRVEVDPVSIPAFRDPIGVQFVPLDSTRDLVTIRPSDPVWSSSEPTCKAGAIIRLQPPATASDADVTRVREWFLRSGAVRVRVEPRAAGEKVVAPVETKPAVRASMRTVVLEMAEEARTHNREALRAELDRALSEEGI